jgi:8-oxo-dGTP pyrophosphatase MutT (NUDIX family)
MSEFDLASVVARTRARAAVRIDPEDAAAAAVATVLRSGSHGAEVLFILRAEREGDPWSGHMAFPGGMRGACDASLLDTAIRETLEEVGLALDPRSLVARFGDLRTHRNGLRVAQFVFALDGLTAPLVRSAEVAATLWAPLEEAAVLEARRPSADLPSLRFGSYVVWGLTYRMLHRLLVVPSAGEPPPPREGPATE